MFYAGSYPKNVFDCGDIKLMNLKMILGTKEVEKLRTCS